MKRLGAVVLLLACCSLAGCFPEEFVIWSPDGQKAIVRGKDTTYLCDPKGELTPMLNEAVQAACWLPDSKQLLVARTEYVSTWPDLDALLSDAQRKKIAADGQYVLDQMDKFKEDKDKFMPFAGQNRERAGAAMLYLREHRQADLERIFGPKWRNKKLVENASRSISVVQLYELVGNAAKGRAVLSRSVGGIWHLAVSPTGKAFAWTATETLSHRDGPPLATLMVQALNEKAQPSVVADKAGGSFAWSPDGRCLAYAHTVIEPEPNETPPIGTISQRQVCNAEGRIEMSKTVHYSGPATTQPAGGSTSQPTEMAYNVATAPVELGNILFDAKTHIQYLPDGRIVFSAVELNLPAAPEDMPRVVRLFTVNPNVPNSVSRLIPRSMEGEIVSAECFSISPDGKKLAIVGEDGRVDVLSLGNNRVERVQPNEGNAERQAMIPNWRSATDLCYLALSEKAKDKDSTDRFEIVRRGDGDPRPISASWPADDFGELLNIVESTTRPDRSR